MGTGMARNRHGDGQGHGHENDTDMEMDTVMDTNMSTEIDMDISYFNYFWIPFILGLNTVTANHIIHNNVNRQYTNINVFQFSMSKLSVFSTKARDKQLE